MKIEGLGEKRQPTISLMYLWTYRNIRYNEIFLERRKMVAGVFPSGCFSPETSHTLSKYFRCAAYLGMPLGT